MFSDAISKCHEKIVMNKWISNSASRYGCRPGRWPGQNPFPTQMGKIQPNDSFLCIHSRSFVDLTSFAFLTLFSYHVILLRGWASEVWILLKLLHHGVVVILRRSHLLLALQLDHFFFEPFYFMHKFFIFLCNKVITRFYKYLLNARLACLRTTWFSASQINLNLWACASVS